MAITLAAAVAPRHSAAQVCTSEWTLSAGASVVNTSAPQDLWHAGMQWTVGAERARSGHCDIGGELAWSHLPFTTQRTETEQEYFLDPSDVVAIAATIRLYTGSRAGLFVRAGVGPAYARWGALRSDETLGERSPVIVQAPQSKLDLASFLAIGARSKRHGALPPLEASLQYDRQFSARQGRHMAELHVGVGL